MAETALTQPEADALIAMEKVKADELQHDYPSLGGSIVVPLVSQDRTEQFLLDVRRGRIDLAKVTNQNRARQVVVLVRLDVGGPPHRNPDDAEIACPHLHLYREGFADKWAFPVPPDRFHDLCSFAINSGFSTDQSYTRAGAHRNPAEPLSLFSRGS